jgi:hypothetical protein
MTMHAVSRNDGKLRTCMVAMRHLDKMYPAAGWTRKVFEELLEQRNWERHMLKQLSSSSERLGGSDESESGIRQATRSNGYATTAPLDLQEPLTTVDSVEVANWEGTDWTFDVDGLLFYSNPFQPMCNLPFGLEGPNEA